MYPGPQKQTLSPCELFFMPVNTALIAGAKNDKHADVQKHWGAVASILDFSPLNSSGQ